MLLDAHIEWISLFLFSLVSMKTYIGTVLISGMLLVDVIVSLRPSVTVKVAFMVGSSKQGKERRASVASNCVTARYLIKDFQFR